MRDLTDTHTHLFTAEFDADRSEVVERALAAGVARMVTPNIDLRSVAPMLQLCDRYPGRCYPAIGLHPTDLGDNPQEQLDAMEQMLDRQGEHRFVAIGEVGLDFYWDDSRRQEQIAVFERQISWAQKYGLPLIIHSRNAFDELYRVMDRHRASRLTGIFHCFGGSEQEARALLGFPGFLLGIGGTVTYKKSPLPQTLAAAVPIERIVLETDSPYLSPVPLRGQRNESAHIVHTAQKVAQIYGLTPQQVAHITTANAAALFGFDEKDKIINTQ